MRGKMVMSQKNSLRNRIEIIQDDITKMHVDAIVNAANTSLLGGGGVDGAIHRAAGHGLFEECIKLGGCRTGQAKVTGAYNLPCRMVIHTVGPVWQGGGAGEAELLWACYVNSIKAAMENDAKTVAFPAISTGAYGYPLTQAASIACRAVKRMLEEYPPDKLKKVFFVCFNETAVRAYRNLLPVFSRRSE